MFDINNSAHVSKYIESLTRTADLLFKLQDALDTFTDISDVNDVANVLTKTDARFPAGTSVSPAEVNDARYALVVIKQEFGATLQTGRVLAINKIREALGILAGTG